MKLDSAKREGLRRVSVFAGVLVGAAVLLGTGAALADRGPLPVSGPATGVSAAAGTAVQARGAVVARAAKKKPKPQRFTIHITASGYSPSTVKASTKSSITLTVDKGTGCGVGFLIPSLGISKDNSKHAITFSIGKLAAGTYRFTCGMGMLQGQIVVK